MINKSNKLLSKPRGTQDILPTQALIYQQVQRITQNILNHAGYQPIILPTYEYQEVFTTSVGETTDIVQKEMFTFQDRKARWLVLRPEGTAGAVRLICQNKLVNSGFPLRVYYWGNMFRYERPQKGRYREFWQLGVELVNAQGLLADGELLWLIKQIVKELNLSKKIILHWNYLGNQEIIVKYKLSLKTCLANKIKKLCLDCQERYQTNPLRILDCKICDLPELPSYEKTLKESSSSSNYLGELRKFLDKLEINHYYNEKLVRGLDYYTGIVFELLLNNEGGKQSVILGGGRYDQLFRQLGEKWNSSVGLPAAGFALGIDRLVDYFSSLHQQDSIRNLGNSEPDILFLILEKPAYFLVLQWKEKLSQKYKVVCNLDLTESNSIKKTKNIFKNINYHSPHLVVTVGSRELVDTMSNRPDARQCNNNEPKILIKDCQKKQNIWVNQAELVNWIDNYLAQTKKNKF